MCREVVPRIVYARDSSQWVTGVLSETDAVKSSGSSGRPLVETCC